MSISRREQIAQAGPTALAAWKSGDFNRNDAIMATRYTLDRLSQICPGQSVEVRVPPAAAVQIRPGSVHRRGQPPAVVEMTVDSWLRLATGRATWADLVASGDVYAFGLGSDLADLLPLPL